jgi:hypothetical protein
VRSARGPKAVLATLPLIAAALFGAPGPVAAAPSAAVGQPAAQVVLRAGDLAAPTAVLPARAGQVSARAVTFSLSYSGFTPAARAAFQRAVNLWAPQITSTVPITVNASFVAQPAGQLGSAGPSSFWRDFPGAPRPGTWYPDALANKRFGAQLNPSADIVARFNSTRTDWHFGSGPAPAGRIDFTRVVMHELGHGLGFLGAGQITNGRGTVRLDLTPRLPTAYDRFTENGAGTSLLTGFPDLSTQLATQLRSGNLHFDSPQVRNANGGARARIYAPATFQPGSSYSHLDEATYRPGTANSLMTPFLNFGETIRNPGPITRAIFVSTGW